MAQAQMLLSAFVYLWCCFDMSVISACRGRDDTHPHKVQSFYRIKILHKPKQLKPLLRIAYLSHFRQPENVVSGERAAKANKMQTL